MAKQAAKKAAKPVAKSAKRIHAVIKAVAPAPSPRTWYGMPAYAKDDTELSGAEEAKIGELVKRAAG